jgi:hypothetical protein
MWGQNNGYGEFDTNPMAKSLQSYHASSPLP